MKLTLASPWFPSFLPTSSPQACTRPGAHPVIRVQTGATLEVPQPAGQCLVCVEGDLWITHDGDCKDVILKAGERYTSDRASRMLVHALAASAVLLHAEEGAGKSRP